MKWAAYEENIQFMFYIQNFILYDVVEILSWINYLSIDVFVNFLTHLVTCYFKQLSIN